MNSSKSNPPKVNPTYFDVVIEAQAPVTLKFRVLAENAEQALEIVQTRRPNPIMAKTHFHRKKDLKATIYDAGCCVIKFLKRLR